MRLKNKLLMLLLAFILVWNVFAKDVTKEDCNTWVYKNYYNSSATTCGYFRIYVWEKLDYPDYWVWTIWKERLISSSASSITVTNLDSSKYNISYNSKEFSSNWISSTADEIWYTWKKPVIWWVYDFWIDNTQDVSKLDKNKPVARIDRKIKNFIVVPDGSITPPHLPNATNSSVSDWEWKYCVITKSTDANWNTMYSACSFENNDNKYKKWNDAW